MHVLIDSSIYRTDPKRTKAGFQAITQLAETERIQLHLPHYVRKEFLTQQADQLSREFDKIKQAGTSVLRVIDHDNTVDAVKRILNKVEELNSEAMAIATEQFDTWIADTKTEMYDVDDSYGKRVTDAYFAGNAPFRSPKKRDDFPDAFIYQTVQDIAEKQDRLHVIVADCNLRKACERLKNVTTHRDIEKFISLPECQALLRELDEVRNIDRIREFLPQETEVLQCDLETQIIDPLAKTIFWESSIPNDDPEVTVESVGTPRETSFKFNAVEYYGNGRLIVPFSTLVECIIGYFIDKSDWYIMNEEKSKGISVTDWNKHYFAAEETRDLDVEGRVILELPTDELQQEDLSEKDISALVNGADCRVEIEEASVHKDYPY